MFRSSHVKSWALNMIKNNALPLSFRKVDLAPFIRKFLLMLVWICLGILAVLPVFHFSSYLISTSLTMYRNVLSILIKIGIYESLILIYDPVIRME